jgi:L-alanine-DL-glutamate epimerase-like enolase superfamily enzyme
VRITRIETIPIRVPIKPELAIKSGRGGTHDTSPFLIVKLHTDAGLVGLGEASCTPRWSGEDQVSAAHFINTYFAPALIGQDPTRIDELTRTVFPPVAGNYFTKAAVEMALWDIAGKAAGKPVYELLGGKVRDAVTTKWSISGTTPDRAAEIARWALGHGFRAMKVKVGLSQSRDGEGADADFDRVAAVRSVIGPDIKLGVDANGGWGDAATAVAAIERLKPLGIAFAEQPVWAGDPEEMAAVRRAAGVPIIADESLYTLADAQQLARAAACDVFSIYVGKAGGIGPAKAIADFALSRGIGCTIGSNLELGVGSAAMLHLGLAHRGITPDKYPCDIIGPFYYEADILKEPLDLGRGRAAPNGRPGLGVDLNEDMLEKYRGGGQRS